MLRISLIHYFSHSPEGEVLDKGGKYGRLLNWVLTLREELLADDPFTYRTDGGSLMGDAGCIPGY